MSVQSEILSPVGTFNVVNGLFDMTRSSLRVVVRCILTTLAPWRVFFVRAFVSDPTGTAIPVLRRFGFRAHIASKIYI